jgi:predicted RNase H-like nuclease (RuvC/YqgF family)
MRNYVIGIDPGSTKGHGVAVYQDGELVNIKMSQLMPLYSLLTTLKQSGNVIVHIEDVMAQKAVWHGKKQSKAAYGKTSQNVALCKWAQVEVERMCEYIDVDVVKHRVSSCWKKDNGKAQFEKVTGWKGRSNEDTRSAAYFGWLGLK